MLLSGKKFMFLSQEDGCKMSNRCLILDYMQIPDMLERMKLSFPPVSVLLDFNSVEIRFIWRESSQARPDYISCTPPPINALDPYMHGIAPVFRRFCYSCDFVLFSFILYMILLCSWSTACAYTR